MRFILVILFVVSTTTVYALDTGNGFTENKGQLRSMDGNIAADEVLAFAKQGRLSVFFHADKVSYQLSATEEEGSKTFIHRIDLKLVNSQMKRLEMSEEQPNQLFYYTGKTHEAIAPKTYAELRYPEVYPGVDWVWLYKEGQLKHEFRLAAGAAHDKIAIEIIGANATTITPTGMLELTTQLGEIQEEAPLSYVGGKLVSSAFILSGNQLRYQVDRNINNALVIDPNVRWSTYYGGNGEDLAAAIDSDTEGNLYLTGKTSSTTLFATVPGYSTYALGSHDAFLLKFSAEGQLIWSAYFGGTGNDVGYALSVSPSGAMIAFGGYTQGSTNLAAGMHPNQPHQQNVGNDGHDGFVAVFSPTGQRYWSTYYGGNATDFVYGLRWKGDSTLIVVGETFSDSSIATIGAHQNSLGGFADGFVVAFTQTGNRLWASYYGGLNRDYLGDVDFFSNGDILLAGATNSFSDISTTGTQQANHGGVRDFMLVRFSPGGQRIWGTYYGGNGTEDLNHARVDFRDQVYIYGTTSTISGMGFNGFQMSYGGSGLDGFIGRFSPTGQRLWSSYFGGNSFDNGRGMALDHQGNAYFTGIYGSSNLSTTPNAIQPNYGGGSYDSPLLKLDSLGNVLWLSYFGGSGDDMAHAAVYSGGFLHITGSATTNYPLLEPYQSFLRGTSDIMLTSFNVCDAFVQINRGTSGILCANDTLTLTATPGYSSYIWSTGDTTQQIQVTAAGNYWVRVTDFSSECPAVSDTLVVQFSAPVEVDTIFGNTSPLVGDIVSYAVTQQLGFSYQWQVSGGTIVAGLNTSLIQVAWTLDGPGNVYVRVADSIGCADSANVPVMVRTGVGVAQQSLNKLKVYPNPSAADFYFSWEGESALWLRLTDLGGRLLYEDKNFINGSRLRLGELPAGVYFYQLTDEQSKTTFGRLVRQSE